METLMILTRAAALGGAATALMWFVAIAANFYKTVASEDMTFQPGRSRKAMAWYLKFGAIRLAGLAFTGTSTAAGLIYGLQV